MLSGGRALTTPLYRNPEPLSPERHGAKGVVDPLNFDFCRAVTAVPLGLAEIPLAALSYPIVFLSADALAPVAMLGLEDGRNLFVDEAGAWMKGAYVPAYMRRYPFILAKQQADGKDDLTLCIDNHPRALCDGGGRPLFQDSAPTPMVRSALKFCRSVLAGDRAARPFCDALQALDLLDGRVVEIDSAAARIELGGFLTINETKFRSLADEAFLLLRRRGWLTPAFAQIQSALNWQRLAELAGSN